MKKPKMPKAAASTATWKRYETRLDEYNKEQAIKDRIKKKAHKY